MSSARCLPLIQLGTIAVFADTEFEIFLKSSALLELGFAVPIIVRYDMRGFERKRERSSMNARTLLKSFYMCCIGWKKNFILVGLVERSMELDLELQWGTHDQA
jgi:hypothetical protein